MRTLKTLQVNDDTHYKIKLMATLKRVSISELMKKMLDFYLENHLQAKTIKEMLDIWKAKSWKTEKRLSEPQ